MTIASFMFLEMERVPHCTYVTCSLRRSKYVKYRVVPGSSKPLTCTFQIKQELEANKHLQTGLVVYEDFLHYKDAINHPSYNSVDSIMASRLYFVEIKE